MLGLLIVDSIYHIYQCIISSIFKEICSIADQFQINLKAAENFVLSLDCNNKGSNTINDEILDSCSEIN